MDFSVFGLQLRHVYSGVCVFTVMVCLLVHSLLMCIFVFLHNENSYSRPLRERKKDQTTEGQTERKLEGCGHKKLSD